MTAIATAQAYEPRYIRLDPKDNVAIVVNDLGLPAGSRFACGLELRTFVPQGHDRGNRLGPVSPDPRCRQRLHQGVVRPLGHSQRSDAVHAGAGDLSRTKPSQRCD